MNNDTKLICPRNPSHVREPNDRGHYFCRECAKAAGRRGGKAAAETRQRMKERRQNVEQFPLAEGGRYDGRIDCDRA